MVNPNMIQQNQQQNPRMALPHMIQNRPQMMQNVQQQQQVNPNINMQGMMNQQQNQPQQQQQQGQQQQAPPPPYPEPPPPYPGQANQNQVRKTLLPSLSHKKFSFLFFGVSSFLKTFFYNRQKRLLTTTTFVF
jgi:hypothetical protein